MSKTAKIALFAGVLLAPIQAYAQSTQVEEIVVTAQKREERLLDVGVNVSALPAEVLEDRRVNQVTDVLGLVPNIDIKEQVPGAMPVITVRGVGLDDFSATNNPSTGVYVDEVFLTSTAMMSSELFDLERVEVLKGPQGTLYGRNTTAGALNIITAKPKQAFEAMAKVGYGSFETFEAEGMVNVPMGETAAIRAAVRAVDQNEGYWTSRLLPGETLGQRNILAGRVQVAVALGAEWDANLKLEGLRSRSEMGQGEFFGTFENPFSFAPCAPILAGRIDNTQCTDFFGYTDTDGDPFVGDWPKDAFYDIDAWDVTATLKGSIGSVGVTSITGYRESDRGFEIDSDATPLRQVDFTQTDQIRQVSQELRLNGQAGMLDWIAGAFYSHDNVKVNTPGDHLDFFATTTLIEADQDTDAAAVFFHGDWRLTEQLKLITGLRYTLEERSYVGGTRDLNPFGASFLCMCAVPTQLSFIDDDIEDQNLTWKLGLDFKPTDRSLIYASVSKGVKSGGFFSGITTNTAELLPFEPEEIIAYEVGAKAELFDRSMLISASAFYYDYSDVQTFIRAPGAIPVQKLGNVDEATVQGLDLDVLWRPVSGLTLNAGLGLLETELGAFTTTAGDIPAGNELPNAPELSFTGSAKYEWSIGGFDASAQAGAAYTDDVFKDANNDPIVASGAHWLYDARATLGPADGPWEVAVWGENLSDEQYVVQGLNVASLGFGNRIFNAPRTYGVTLTWRWR
jgi:iron complex outermembrane receptor protein